VGRRYEGVKDMVEGVDVEKRPTVRIVIIEWGADGIDFINKIPAILLGAVVMRSARQTCDL